MTVRGAVFFTGLDRYLTGGQPHSQEAELTCPDCGHEWTATVRVEYGAIVSEPECPACRLSEQEEADD